MHKNKKKIDQVTTLPNNELSMYISGLENTIERLTRELNRYKDIIRDIKKYDGLTAKTIEDIRDMKC
jgi:hypothetical protein